MDERRIVVRWKVLFISIVIVGAGIPIAAAWHDHQTYLQADAYLQRAKSLEQSTDWDGAAQVYHRYLQLRPDDSQARLLLAGALDQAGEEFSAKYRALEYYRFVLGLLPGNVAVHQRVAELSLDLGKYSDAEQYGRSLLQADPGNPAALRVIALAAHAASRFNQKTPFAKLDEAYAAAEKANPSVTELFVNHARLCREDPSLRDPADKAKQADEVMKRLVDLNPDSTAAFLARHAYRVRFGLPDADADLDEAILIKPHDLDVQLAAAERAFRRGLLDESVRFFERAAAAVPRDRRPYLRLSEVLLARGDSDGASSVLKRGLTAVSENDMALCAQLAALSIERGETADADSLLDRMNGVFRRIESRLPSPDRLQLQCGLEWVRANLLIAQRRFMPAIRLLHSVQAMRDENAGFTITNSAEADIYAARGKCYMAIGEWDRAADDFSKAAAKNPKTSRYILAAAEAFEAGGRFEDAVHAYERALTISDAAPAARTSLAAAHFRMQMAVSPEARDWSAFQKALNAAQKTPSLALRLLEAEFAYVQGGRDDALALLKSLERDYADDPRLWSAIAGIYQRSGDAKAATAAVAKIAGHAATDDETILLQADLLSRSGAHDEARRLLEKRLARDPSKNRLQFETVLAEFLLRAGRADEGRAEIFRLAALPEADSRLLVLAGDLALASDRPADAERLEQRLREMEGKDGCLWRDLRIRRLLAGVTSPVDPVLLELDRLQREIVAIRPQWSRAYLLAGLLKRTQNHPDDAVDAYIQAVELGETQIDVLKDLATLLFNANRIADAERYLKRCGTADGDLRRPNAAAMFAHFRRGDLSKAVELAQSNAASRGDDVLPLIWLGHLLLLDDRGDEAEEQFRLAVRQSPQDFRCRLSLLTAQVRLGRKDDARKTIEEMAAVASNDAAQKEFALAQAYAIVGDTEAARRHFVEARNAAPDDLAVRQAYATFLAASDPLGAERELRQILSASPAAGAARRALASILAARGGEAAWKEAWSLMDESAAHYAPTDADRRLKALLLAHHGTSERRREAIGILDALVTQSRHPAAGDRLLLAKLYDDSRKVPEARKQLDLLASSPDADPGQIAVFADFLLRHGDFPAADKQIARIENKPENEFLAVPLRVRCLHGQHRDDEIPPLADGFLTRYLASVRTADEKFAGLVHAAALYAEVGMPAQAERLYRQANTSSPRGFRLLARHLAFSGKQDEAVALCLTAAEKEPDADTVKVLCAALSRSAGSPQAERAEKVLAVAAEKHAADAGLLTELATLRYFQARYDEAVVLFEKVLVVAPENWQACNNLANLLSERPGRRRDAIRYAQKAVELHGNHPDLLDTLGLTLLRSGDAQGAIVKLYEAANSPQTDPRYHFHLALAYHQSGAIQEARRELELSQREKLADAALSPFDRDALAVLEKSLSPQ